MRLIYPSEFKMIKNRLVIGQEYRFGVDGDIWELDSGKDVEKPYDFPQWKRSEQIHSLHRYQDYKYAKRS